MKNLSSLISPSKALNRPLNRQIHDNSAINSQEKEVVIRQLGFQIGNLGLLIGARTTSELIELLVMCPIPFTVAWLLGLINLRGNLVPIFDLHQLLSIETNTSNKRMLLILGQGESAGGIVIEALPVHLTFTSKDKLTSLPPLPAVLAPYVSQGYEKGEQVWFNFDHLGFFESIATKIVA
jgi:chemotaxis signal transduction protein